MEKLTALTVLDGRYSRLTEELKDIFSEYGLIRHRLLVEVKWLRFLVENLKVAEVPEGAVEKIESIAKNFTAEKAQRVKEIEATTNHDVKAVEYYIKEELDTLGLSAIREWTHFACTSDDINNTAYSLMMKAGRSIILARLSDVTEKIEALALEYRDQPLMSRTHGQPATPSTMGKELVNFAWRLRQEEAILKDVKIGAKMNGATGSFNAHVAAFPEIDWIAASRTFIADYLEVEPILFSTQINPNNYIAQVLHGMIRISGTLIDLNRDMWGYISLGYFKQRLKDGEVGSSTMPHKVNPIDFENGEGNLGVAISMMEHLAVKLLQSRFQRDLTDSTVLRNMGSLFGYCLIGFKNSLKGLGKVEINPSMIEADLENNQELLAEPIQTVMRVYGEENPYEKLKALTRGRKVTAGDLAEMIDGLEKVPAEAKDRMKAMTPANYIGRAVELVDLYFAERKK